MRLARDEAEKRWREAKAPAPLPKRLIWAEAKLQKAQAALTRARLQLDQFDEETDKRRAEYCDRIQEADRWYRWRQEQLNSIHVEAAGRAPGGHDRDQAGGGSEEVRQQIRGKMLPEMQAILEELQEGTTLHGRLALVVAGLADAETRLGTRRDHGGADRYNLCEGDSNNGDWDEHGHAHDQGRPGGSGENRLGEESRGERHGGNATGWRPEGPGRWTRASNAGGGKQRSPHDSAEMEETHDPGRAGAAGRTEKGKAAAGGKEGSQVDGPTMQADGDDDGVAQARSGKHRRRQSEAEAAEEERRASDERRGQELRAQLERASAAQEQSYQEGTGGFGSEVALSWAAQKFVLDVQRAQAQAGEMGIEPRAEDGRALLELSPMELKQWVEQNLDDGDMRD